MQYQNPPRRPSSFDQRRNDSSFDLISSSQQRCGMQTLWPCGTGVARAATARALCGTGGANDSMRGIRVNRVNSCEDDVCGVEGRRKTLCEMKRSPTMVLTNERSNTTINSDVDSVGLSVGRLLYVSWWGYRGLSVRPSVGRQSIDCFCPLRSQCRRIASYTPPPLLLNGGTNTQGAH